MTARPKKPERKYTAAPKSAAGNSKKKAAASVKTVAAKPTNPELVDPTQPHHSRKSLISLIYINFSSTFEK
jgi:hypothetical protein